MLVWCYSLHLCFRAQNLLLLVIININTRKLSLFVNSKPNVVQSLIEHVNIFESVQVQLDLNDCFQCHLYL